MISRIAALAILAFCLIASMSFPSVAQTTVTETCHGTSYPLLQGDHEICSYTAQFNGTCNGTDLWNQWTVNASPPSSLSYAIMPFEDHWIKIVGHMITDATASNHTYWQIGSGYVADIQGGLGAGQNSITVMYPAGNVWMYPPAGYNTGGLPLKDLHGSCSGGSSVTVLVTLYYVSAQGLVPPPPPPPLCTTFDSLNPADKAAGISLTNNNLTATSNGANVHALARALTGIVPNTLLVHYEWTVSGMGSGGSPIDIFGLQDGSVLTNSQLGTSGTAFGSGYNPSVGTVYASNFTPAGGSYTALQNGTYAMDYNSVSGMATITGPSGYSTSRTRGTSVTLFPAFSMYGTPSGSVTYNFGASPFTYPVPSGYQAGLCQ